MITHCALVALEGHGLHATFDRIVKPPREVFAQLQVVRIKGKSCLAVGLCLSELLVYFSACLAVVGLTLWTSGCLERVAGHVKPALLVAGDASLTVAAFTHS